MPSPFPGMDPYLEAPDIWPDVHHRLISEIQTALNPELRPTYVARVELRVYISDEDDPGRDAIVPDVRIEETGVQGSRKGKKANGTVTATVEPIIIPGLIDDEIKEARLEIRHRDSNALVTIIEVMSPTNKIRGARGRLSFMEKREETLASNVNWVEIDLLRAGLPSVIRPPLQPCDYRVLVYRAKERGRYWPIGVQQPLPPIPIPLRRKDSVLLDLGAVLKTAYEHGNYDLSVDYRSDADPPLAGADKIWADKLLREHGLRGK